MLYATVILVFHPAVIGVPDRCAFWMTSYDADVVLYNSHGIAIGISCNSCKFCFIACQGTTVEEEHFMWFTIPGYGHGLGVRSFCISIWSCNILYGINIF